ncbi:MAG TPA: hypothetical protein VIZ65_17805 [Cellvibrionaceae bacterium]
MKKLLSIFTSANSAGEISKEDSWHTPVNEVLATIRTSDSASEATNMRANLAGLRGRLPYFPGLLA